MKLCLALTLAVALPSGLLAQDRGPCENCPPADTTEMTRATNYIDSAPIATTVRFRFDSGRDANRPDRAEFFYGKCNCYTAAAGQDSASPGPAARLDYREYALYLEYAVKPRFSLFVESAIRSVDITKPTPPPDFGPGVKNSGFGDLQVGFKYALVPRADSYLTFQLRTYLSTGDAALGLGTDHASIEPALLHWLRPATDLTIESEARWWHPLGGSSDPVTGASLPLGTATGRSPVGRIELPPVSDPPVRNHDFAGDILRFGTSVSYTIHSGNMRFVPVAELVGWYVTSGYQTPPTPGPLGFVEEADKNILNLKFGLRLLADAHNSFSVGYGIPLTTAHWYKKLLRLEYRRNF